MEHIRLATEAETEKIKDVSDITKETLVLALNGNLAVVRTITEIDPLFWKDGVSRAEKTRFVWGLEERAIGAGIPAYYFNISADEATKPWRDVVVSWGAEQVSPGPEIRYKKILIK